MIERIPPHNEEAEKSVLGAIMLDREVLLDVLEILTEDDFYNESHREIFKSITELHNSNVAVDMLTVCDELKKRKSLDMVGGRGYIALLTSEVPSTANAMDYAKIVSEKAMMRRTIKVSESITEKSYSEDMPTNEILEYAESEIFNIAQRKQKNDYTKIQDVILKNLSMIDEAQKRSSEGGITGISTGFKKLDEVTNGLQRSNLVIVAARPGMGKTSFALSIALQSAVKAGSSVIIFSLEMAKEELGQRLLSMQARVDAKKIKQGNLERNDWERLNFAIDDLNKAKIVMDDTPGISIMEMRNKCRRLKREQGLDLIVIDYLQLMSVVGKKIENRVQEISTLSRNLKLLAREMDCPVILLSQLSRAVEQRPNKRPMLSDLRESGSIEQDADIVMFLYRDDYYEKDNENADLSKQGICEINIAKHRSGPTDKIELTWVARYTMFSDVSY